MIWMSLGRFPDGQCVRYKYSQYEYQYTEYQVLQPCCSARHAKGSVIKELALSQQKKAIRVWVFFACPGCARGSIQVPQTSIHSHGGEPWRRPEALPLASGERMCSTSSATSNTYHHVRLRNVSVWGPLLASPEDGSVAPPASPGYTWARGSTTAERGTVAPDTVATGTCSASTVVVAFSLPPRQRTTPRMPMTRNLASW